MAKAAEILKIPATITARGQTTVPAAIRKKLALGKRDQVVFCGLADRTVMNVRMCKFSEAESSKL
jgi:antitoxin PrlF